MLLTVVGPIIIIFLSAHKLKSKKTLNAIFLSYCSSHSRCWISILNLYSFSGNLHRWIDVCWQLTARPNRLHFGRRISCKTTHTPNWIESTGHIVDVAAGHAHIHVHIRQTRETFFELKIMIAAWYRWIVFYFLISAALASSTCSTRWRCMCVCANWATLSTIEIMIMFIRSDMCQVKC